MVKVPSNHTIKSKSTRNAWRKLYMYINNFFLRNVSFFFQRQLINVIFSLKLSLVLLSDIFKIRVVPQLFRYSKALCHRQSDNVRKVPALRTKTTSNLFLSSFLTFYVIKWLEWQRHKCDLFWLLTPLPFLRLADRKEKET